MPTVGWIREGDWEAFLEATESVVNPGPPLLPSFGCPFCTTIASSAAELQQHVSARHFVARPILLLDGVEPSRGYVRRYPTSNTTCLSSTGVVLRSNGKSLPISSERLAKELASIRDADFSIELTNASEANAEPVVSTYDLAFRIADSSELRGVELAFSDAVMPGALTRHVVDQFLHDPRCKGVARDYADGLANFLIGILLKERPATESLSTPFARYRETYGAGLRTLREIKRPFAQLIADIIRFALNDFTQASSNSGYWELDLASKLLTNPEVDYLPPIGTIEEARRKVCPVDHGTGQILDLTVRMSQQRRWSPILSDACRQVATSSLLDDADRQKALAVWAIASWRLGAREESIEPLRQIAAIYPFRIWAERYLEMMTSD
jgi:hypothetical protein